MTKRYLKTPEEVMQALKEEKVVLDRTGNKYKSINGLVVVSYMGGGWGLNAFIGNNAGLYVEEPEPLKLEVGKFYKTRDAKKAFVYAKIGIEYSYPFYVAKIGKLDAYNVNAEGKKTEDKHPLDLIAPWEEH